MLYRLGGFCARHHWPVVAAWLVGVVALAVGFALAGDMTNNNLTLPGSGSTKAADLLDDKLPQYANGSNPLVMKVGSGKMTDSKNSDAVGKTLDELKKVDGVVSTVDPLGPQGADYLSDDQKIAYIPVTLSIDPSDLSERQARDVLDAGDPAENAGMEVAIGGYVGDALSKPSTEDSELIGIIAAMVILLFAFGTAAAMALPIVSAILGLAASLSAIGLLGHLVDVPSVAPTLAAMIGLGVGIDYALFIVTRHKLQLKEGIEMRESIARATATAGGAVAFAGFTVIIALVSLGAAGIPIVTSMGYTAGVAVLISVLAAITLLPAMLGALGPRINKGRVHLGKTHPDDREPHGWRRWAQRVSAHPWPAMTVAILILLVLAWPATKLELGQEDDGTAPKGTQQRMSYDLISEGFGPGTNAPLLIAAQLDPPAKPDKQLQQQVEAQQQQLALDPAATSAQQKKLTEQLQYAKSPASDPRLTRLEREIGKAGDVEDVSPATLNKAADTAIFSAVPHTSPSSHATQNLVNDLRDTVIPETTKGTGVTAYVGGQTAGYIDLANQIADKLPQMILIVVALSFVVLVFAFRSLLVPAKAAIMNLLSVAAAYGVVTFIFQEGHGISLFGFDHAVPIVSFVPLFMFAILFGLSMDYEVFLLTQMREAYRRSGDPRAAVVDGLAKTGRVITSAALIMVFVFASFVLSGDPVVDQFGIGLAVAIAIDATVVRCLLVPAVMTLFGKASWWIPKWLDRMLPHVSIEGEEYFAKLDAKRT